MIGSAVPVTERLWSALGRAGAALLALALVTAPGAASAPGAGALRPPEAGGIPGASAPASVGLAASAPGVPRDTLEGRVIRSLVLVPRQIFDPLPANRLRPAYSLVNHLHVLSRPSTIRSALVVREGDRWSEASRAECERRLRELQFLVPDSVVANPAGDSVDVRVVTQDNWTTSPEIVVEGSGGQRYGSYAFTEGNFLGTGTSITAAHREDPEGASRELDFLDNTLAGSHWQAGMNFGDGAAGRTDGAFVQLPFWADAAPTTLGLAWSRTDWIAQLVNDQSVVATVPRRRDQFVVTSGTGTRAPDGTIQRLIGSYEAIDDHFGVSVLQPGAPPTFAGSDEYSYVHRVAGQIVLWRPNYIVRRGIEQIDRDEDFDLGPQFAVKLGFAPRVFGSTNDEGYGRLDLALGANQGRAGFGFLRASVESRVWSGLIGSLGSANARWMVPHGERWTTVGSAIYEAGHDMPRDFQLVLGGLTGLRAFPVRELAGTEVERLNVESRCVVWHEILQVASLGGAAFWDSGRARGVGSAEEAWHHDVGAGLRLSLPHSALNTVVRFDVAWPLSPMNDTRRGPAYSFGSGQAF